MAEPSKRERQKQQKQAKKEAQAQAQQQRKQRNAMLIGLMVVAIIAVGFFGYRAVMQSSGSDIADLAAPQVTGTKLEPIVMEQDKVGEQDGEVGNKAPTVKAFDFINNKPITIGEGAGKPQAIAIIAHWCGVCDGEVKGMAQVVKDGGVVDGVELIAVTTANNPAQPVNFPPTTWLQSNNWPGAGVYDLDGEAAPILAHYGVPAFPSWIFVDKDGTIVARMPGHLDTQALQHFTQLAKDGAKK